jgi:hypothetical protein
MNKLLIGLGIGCILAALPIWKNVHTGGSQSFFTMMRDQVLFGKVPKHISPEEARLNAKARYTLGIRPRGYRIG